jgi:DNA replication and repair protein RecF
VSVFSPDDLALVKGGPAERRRYLDELLVGCHRSWDGVRSDVDRVLRQRATLLKQAGGRLSTDVALTLDVWDAKLAEAGSALAQGRADLVARLGPVVGAAYDRLAGETRTVVRLEYVAPWREPDGPGLAEALAQARSHDVRRGVSTVGPHRDDVMITVNGLPSRTHASQGEQRSVALALRLGGHSVVTDAVGSAPVLLLDDVFSELDAGRSAALVGSLPAGQAVLTTAGRPPEGVRPEIVVRIKDGSIVG